MSYVGFSNCGYEYFNLNRYVLFSESNAHEFLFNYVSQDLSHLPELFDQYISQRMDTSTFKLHDGLGDDTTLDQMKNILTAAHPYYKHEVRDILIRAIGKYFNRLLLYSFFQKHTNVPEDIGVWYHKRITVLMKPLLEVGDTYPTDFYNEYQKRVGGDMDFGDIPETEMELLVGDVPQKMPIGFIDEIFVQREAYNMLYFLLDVAAEGLEKLTMPQRIWLYSNIMTDGGDGIKVLKKFSLKHHTLYRAGHDHSPEIEYNGELYDKFRPLHALNNLNIGRDGVPAEMSEAFYSVIDYAKTVTPPELYDEYEVDSLYQILYLEILQMVQNNVMIRKCRRCGKYFVVPNRKVAYCSRVDESGACCSDVGPREAFRKKLEDDKPLNIYNRAYKTHFARVTKGTMSKSDFQAWCDEAKTKLTAARAGELDIAAFQEWLKK